MDFNKKHAVFAKNRLCNSKCILNYTSNKGEKKTKNKIIIFCSLITLLMPLFYTSTVNAALRDPTKPAYFSISKGTESKLSSDLTLSSIWISGKTKRVTINGIVARQGDIILSDIKIIKINDHSVLIKQNGITRKLTMLRHSYKSRKKPATFQ